MSRAVKASVSVLAVFIAALTLSACATVRTMAFNSRELTIGRHVQAETTCFVRQDSLAETIRSSPNVVMGEVLEAYSFQRDNERVYTVARVRIDGVLKGSVMGDIYVVSLGGYIAIDRLYTPVSLQLIDPNDQFYYYATPDTLSLEPGGRYLFALTDWQAPPADLAETLESGYYLPVALPFGTILLNGDGKAYATDLALRGAPEADEGLADPATMDVKELTERVKRILRD